VNEAPWYRLPSLVGTIEVMLARQALAM
jgi:hypothetical protein